MKNIHLFDPHEQANCLAVVPRLYTEVYRSYVV